MPKPKRKLTLEQRRARRRCRRETEIVFINGKQKRIRRSPTIDGQDVDEFIRRNADPVWLHQNGMWEHMDEPESSPSAHKKTPIDADDEIPF